MSKNLTYKILAAVMALSAANWALPADVSAGYVEYGDYYVTADGETISKNYPNVYGNGHSFTITGCTIGNVYGAGNGNYYEDASGSNVTINGNAKVTGVVHGGRSISGEAYNNTVNISGGSVEGFVYGGYSVSGGSTNDKKSSSAVMLILKRLSCMDTMILHPAPAIPLPLTVGAAVRNLCKTSAILILIM